MAGYPKENLWWLMHQKTFLVTEPTSSKHWRIQKLKWQTLQFSSPFYFAKFASGITENSFAVMCSEQAHRMCWKTSYCIMLHRFSAESGWSSKKVVPWKGLWYGCSLHVYGRGLQSLDGQGLGMEKPADLEKDDDEFEAYRKRMMLAYRFRPNPLVTILLLSLLLLLLLLLLSLLQLLLLLN